MEEATVIDPMRRRWPRFLIPAAWILAGWVVVGVFLCVFFDVRCLDDVRAYRCMMKQSLHPIWKDLALRRIHNGSDLARTIRKHPPTKREEYRPYAAFFYSNAGSYDTVRIIATRGVLVYADAYGYNTCSSHCVRWEYVFFSNPAHSQPMDDAYQRHRDQVRLEEDAMRIHRAIAAGQDVILGRQVERRESADRPADEMTRQYEEIYGRDYAKLLGLIRTELTVEISQSLFGNLKPGTQLALSVKDCRETDLAESELVVLHVQDFRIVFPGTEGGEGYVIVPKRALEWYQSLAPDEIRDLDARCAARETDP